MMVIKKIAAKELFIAEEDRRTSRYHFSFADYKDSTNNRYGVLRALNDELIQPGSGFDMHPHNETEIISYCVHGELSHSDNIGNHKIIRRGDVQYMCAGSGITHAEMNDSTTQTLRFIQVWILPDQRQLHPYYDCKSYSAQDRRNKFLQITSGTKIEGAFQIHQDANIFVSEITKDYQVLFTQPRKRQSYLVCLEGNMDVNGIELHQHEALRSSGEMELIMRALDDSHLLMVEIPEG